MRGRNICQYCWRSPSRGSAHVASRRSFGRRSGCFGHFTGSTESGSFCFALFGSNASAVGGSLFFDGAQRKVTKRKGAFPDNSELASLICLAIFRLTIHGSVGKRRTSCAPPTGSSEGCCDQAFLEATANSIGFADACLALAFDSRCESLTRYFARPQRGGAHGCAPFSVEPWMASLKIVLEPHTSGELCRERPLSFGYFSLRPYKEK
jgi:hypothetical protein